MAHFSAELKPTFHYTVTHFIIYAIKDGSAYWLLNEASEKFNDVLKKELKAIGTGPGKQVGKSGRDILATFLRRHRLRAELKKLGLGGTAWYSNPTLLASRMIESRRSLQMENTS